MPTPPRAALLALLPALALASSPRCPPGPGPIVAVGGGGTPRAVVARALELAGGPGARVLVLPQASEREEAGEDAAGLWRAAGARRVEVLDPADREAARAALARADLVWMSGGDQSRLVDALVGAGLVDDLRARHAAGAVVGGTSAGAAALSSVMLTGRADLERIARDDDEGADGLGLWPGVIVDQHFVRRRRFHRLLAEVLERPGLVGVGIDERTAAIVRGGELEVMGEGQVLVIDARAAEVASCEPGAPHAARGIRLELLRAGSRWRLEPPPKGR